MSVRPNLPRNLRLLSMVDIDPLLDFAPVVCPPPPPEAVEDAGAGREETVAVKSSEGSEAGEMGSVGSEGGGVDDEEEGEEGGFGVVCSEGVEEFKAAAETGSPSGFEEFEEVLVFLDDKTLEDERKRAVAPLGVCCG